MNTKILLISPPEVVLQQFVTHNIYFPLGLMYIASAIRDISEVKIINCMITDNKPVRLGKITRVGMSYEEIEEKIREFKPDIVGISAMIFPLLDGAIAIGKIAKKVNPKTTVVFGGAYNSVNYERFLKKGYCDYCVIGEGEETFREFVEKYNAKKPLTNIKGLAYIENNKLVFEKRELIKDLDKVPYPAYDLVDVEEYFKRKMVYSVNAVPERALPVITSRGCPFNCVFCAIKKHMGQVWRPHSDKYVVKHIKYLKEKYKLTKIHFLDDNVSANQDRFMKILKGITPLKIKWDDPSAMRGDTLNYKILKKMKESGNTNVDIAIESGNQDVVNRIVRKNISLKKVEEVARDCKKLNIKLGAYYIIGFPGETKKNMKETVDFAIRLLKDYNVSPCLYVANPIFGTDLYKICEEKGYIKKGLTEHDLAMGQSINGTHLITTEEFNSKDIDNLIQHFKYHFNRYYNFRHPIQSLRTFVFLFKQHPVLAVKRTVNWLVKPEVKLT